MEIKQQLEREPYCFKDIRTGELFIAKEKDYDPSLGDFEREYLYLKLQRTEAEHNNAVCLNSSPLDSGKRVHFKDDTPVEYVKAEIIIKERLKDYHK